MRGIEGSRSFLNSVQPTYFRTALVSNLQEVTKTFGCQLRKSSTILDYKDTQRGGGVMVGQAAGNYPNQCTAFSFPLQKGICCNCSPHANGSNLGGINRGFPESK